MGRFTVALRCAGGEIALHLNARFNPGVTLGCNAVLGGLWGDEEFCTPPPCGLHPGGALEILINAQECGYQVAVNGQHALEFLHRLPLASVQALDVTGDVTLTSVTFTLYTPVTISNPSIPLHVALSKGPSGLIQTITIVGTVHPNADRFHANLWSSSLGDVVLHVNPRLRESVLVCNTRRCGCWGPEERHTAGAMPFQRGQPFQLEIRPQIQAFALWVNGRHVCDYHHRLPPTSIDQLEVTGDVTLACVKC
ncbi:galectin-5-like [Athene noctua]|uniref:galectin-5-like n=1 Tax=Athene noctua TaxID=126797 RepID=UPI003EBC6AE0